MNCTLYGEIDQNFTKTFLKHYQNNVFWVLFTLPVIKTSKCIENHLYGKTKRPYQKRVFWVFFERVRNQNAKKYEKHSIWK